MKVNIIGAGVSGISAGCYLQMCGFKTVIFERSGRPGGLCTSWKKGDYTFESGFQWLLGSGPANPFYQLWSELLDMKSIQFVNHESRMDIELKHARSIKGDSVFHLYTNLGTLRSYMIENSPGDQVVIDQFIQRMRKIQSFEIPPQIKKVPALLPLSEKIKYIRYLPLLWFLNRIKKETNFTFASKLKSPFLREAFELLFDGDELPLMIISMPLAYNDMHASGYPLGGAAVFINKLKDKYLELGGSIQYHSPVLKVLTADGRATGLLLESGDKVSSEVVLSAADWYFTVFKALDGKYVNKTIRSLGRQDKLKVYYSIILVSLGIGRTFDDVSHFLRFPLDHELVSPDGTAYSRLESHIYNYDPTLAPEGKTMVSVCFYTRNADYWVNLREADPDKYDKSKNDFASEVIDLMEKKFGNIKQYTEEVDVATPATLSRYTNNWKGSAQGWLPGKNMIAQSPVEFTLPGIKNFYYTGHWSIPGGGLPVAIKSARDAVQIICRDSGQKFVPGNQV